MDNPNHNQELSLEPQGVLHAKVHRETCVVHILMSSEASVMTCRSSVVVICDLDHDEQILLLWILQLRFIDTVVERQPKLRRQRCIFTKERGNDKLFVVSVSAFVSLAQLCHASF